jgi:hypothetical protein
MIGIRGYVQYGELTIKSKVKSVKLRSINEDSNACSTSKKVVPDVDAI